MFLIEILEAHQFFPFNPLKLKQKEVYQQFLKDLQTFTNEFLNHYMKVFAQC